MSKLKLVSFSVCPFVQRSIIALNIKWIDFDIEYIDLENKPDWFDKLSPLWKVPILFIDDNTVIFESDVINEYIDEIIEPSLFPQDPLNKAWHRAWLKYSNEVLSDFSMMLFSKNNDEFEKTFNIFINKLEKLEDIVSLDWYFSSNWLSLVDCGFAVIFYRLFLFENLREDQRFKSLKWVYAWAKNLNNMEEVKNSVWNNFYDNYSEFLKSKSIYLYNYLK